LFLQELLSTIQSYLNGRIPHPALRRWLGLHLQEALDGDDPVASSVAQNLFFAHLELRDGEIDETGFQEIVRAELDRASRSLAPFS
jgi:hypothetical protein